MLRKFGIELAVAPSFQREAYVLQSPSWDSCSRDSDVGECGRLDTVNIPGVSSSLQLVVLCQTSI